jgi:hypothetical protein
MTTCNASDDANAVYEPEPRVKKKGVPLIYWFSAGMATVIFPPSGLIGIAIGILASQF